MLSNGVLNKHTGNTHYAAILFTIGDWQWLAKSGNMTRSYLHVAKHASELANPTGICHLCHAGKRGYSFEEFTRNPSWLSSFCCDQPFNIPSPLLGLKHVPGMQATLFKYDVWHSWHLGVGRAFVASVLALMSLECEGRSKEARIQQLSDAYFAWCRQTSTPPILSKLSTEMLNWETNNSFPVGSWYKAGITTNLCLFIESQLGDRSGDGMLDLCAQAVKSINAAIGGLYSEEVFMTPEKARELGEQGLRFLRRYSVLAHNAMAARQALFVMLPKHHVLHHVFLQDLLLASQKYAYIINPLCFSVQLCEDFIGNISRLSRRVHPTLCSLRCVQRHLQHAYRKYVEAGFLVEERA